MDKEVKRTKIVLITLLLVIYLAGYPAARTFGLLIHGKGYMTKNGQRVVAEHRIQQGDFGVPVFTPGSSMLASIANLIYYPIKPIEVMYLNIKQPKGSAW